MTDNQTVGLYQTELIKSFGKYTYVISIEVSIFFSFKSHFIALLINKNENFKCMVLGIQSQLLDTSYNRYRNELKITVVEIHSL